MVLKKLFKESYCRFLSTVAALCFLLSIVSFVTVNIIDDYNDRVRREQIERQLDADYGIRFAVDAGPDYRPPYRTWIMLLAGLGFLLTYWRRLLILSFLPYMIITLIVYDWIVRTMRDLSYAPYYMADSPYFLRIATIYDWLVFASVSLTIVVQIGLILHFLVGWTKTRKLAT